MPNSAEEAQLNSIVIKDEDSDLQAVLIEPLDVSCKKKKQGRKLDKLFELLTRISATLTCVWQLYKDRNHYTRLPPAPVEERKSDFFLKAAPRIWIVPGTEKVQRNLPNDPLPNLMSDYLAAAAADEQLAMVMDTTSADGPLQRLPKPPIQYMDGFTRYSMEGTGWIKICPTPYSPRISEFLLKVSLKMSTLFSKNMFRCEYEFSFLHISTFSEISIRIFSGEQHARRRPGCGSL